MQAKKNYIYGKQGKPTKVGQCYPDIPMGKQQARQHSMMESRRYSFFPNQSCHGNKRGTGIRGQGEHPNLPFLYRTPHSLRHFFTPDPSNGSKELQFHPLPNSPKNNAFFIKLPKIAKKRFIFGKNALFSRKKLFLPFPTLFLKLFTSYEISTPTLLVFWDPPPSLRI